MHLPASPAIQIVPLTRGSVVIAGQQAYACTSTADVLSTVGMLLDDGSLARPMNWPTAEEQGYTGPQVAVPPVGQPAPAQTPAEEERNPLYQRNNLLHLCDAVSSGRITEEQFTEYLDQVCPDISLDEVQLTRDSFIPRDDGVSQLPTDPEGSVVLHD